MANDFLNKIRAEAEKNGFDIDAEELLNDEGTEDEIYTGIEDTEPVPEIPVNKTIEALHTFTPPAKPKLSGIDIAVEAMAEAIIVAMSEADISTIDPDIFGQLVSFSEKPPTGFKLYNPKFLKNSYFVLEHSNRIAKVHKIIEDAYSKTNEETIALPMLQKTKLTLTVLGKTKEVDVNHLLFSEEEIFKISLPYVAGIWAGTDGHDLFCMIDVTR